MRGQGWQASATQEATGAGGPGRLPTASDVLDLKYLKTCLGWEDVRLLDLEGIRTLVALGRVAAGFLFNLGVTFESSHSLGLCGSPPGPSTQDHRFVARLATSWGFMSGFQTFRREALDKLSVKMLSSPQRNP